MPKFTQSAQGARDVNERMPATMPGIERDRHRLRRVSGVYDRYARVYDTLFGRVLQDGRRKFTAILKTRKGDRLLEVGVGSGLMLRAYPNDVSVVGIDISERMLESARRKVRRYGLEHVELYTMDAERMTFETGSFDHVVLAYVYSVTPDPRRLIAEARRVCKPGGDIYVINHFSGLGPWKWLERPFKSFAGTIGFRTEFPFDEFVTDMGWDIVDVRVANLLGLSRVVHFRNT